MPLFSQTSITDKPLVQVLENKDYSYYVGTWRWEDSTTQSEFVIQLVLTERISSINRARRTYLKGAYLYKRGGEILVDYMNELSEDKDFVRYPIYVHNDGDNNMQLGVRDYLLRDGYGKPKHHGGSSYIKYVSSDPEQIRWKIVDDEFRVYVDEKMVDPPGISLPDDIILTKVE